MPLDKKSSKRHALVKRIVLLSFLLTGIFGLGSTMFALAQYKYTSHLEDERLLKAFKTSLSIDKQYHISEFQDSTLRCQIKYLQSCYDLLSNIVITRNRLEDYSILLRKSLYLAKDNELITSIENARARVDELTEEIFGLSMSKASDLRIRTIDDYITFIANRQNDLATARESNEMIVELENIVKEMYEELNNTINSYESMGIKSIDLYKRLSFIFWIMILSQSLLTIIIYLVDLITNNADPEVGNEFTFDKVFPKVKPLALTYFLAFVAMVTTQRLLYRQVDINMITHCRELNKQNIGFINTLHTYNNSQRSLALILKMMPTEYCSSIVNEKISSNLSEFDNYKTSDPKNKIEVISMILKIYADGYQDKLSDMSTGMQTTLFFLVIINVASMTSMSVFLWLDSLDIG